MDCGRLFRAFLVFFISVGEGYTVSVLWIGRRVYIHKQQSYMDSGLICYILSYCIGYFVNPAIWRMGQLSGATSIGDVIGWRYNSEGLQVIVALVAIIFLTPWIQASSRHTICLNIST